MNEVYTPSWTCEELGMISNKVKLFHRTRVEGVSKFWMDIIFCIPKKINPEENVIIDEMDQQCKFEPAAGPYGNAYIFGPK